MGKHVHCQKPLTHSIWEARRLGEIARETGVATQMGNQYTAFNPMRKAAHQIQEGQIGDVKEVHIWTNRPIWPQGEQRGPASRCRRRSTGKRGSARRRFGPTPTGITRSSGAVGGTSAPVRLATWRATRATCRSWHSNMRDPISVEAECPEHDGDSYPPRSKIKFEFPEARQPSRVHNALVRRRKRAAK